MKPSGSRETVFTDLGWFNEGSGSVLSRKGDQKVTFLTGLAISPHPVVLFFELPEAGMWLFSRKATSGQSGSK